MSWRGLLDTIRVPGVGRLVLLSALNVLAFAALEGTFALYLRERLGWGEDGAMFGFAFLGLVSAVVQGGLIRRLVPRFGEPRLITIGLALSVVGFTMLGVVTSTPAVLGAILAVGLGQGLASPSIAGLLSRTTPASEQGAVFGVTSSAQTLARMINHFAGNVLLGWVAPSAPFWEAAAIAAVAVLLAVLTLRPSRVAKPSDADLELAQTAAPPGSTPRSA